MAAKKATFDLTAASAARREAIKETFSFKWQGRTYDTVPTTEWPIDVKAMLSNGNLADAVREVVVDGDDFLATRPSIGDIERLLDAIAEFMGVNTTGE